MITSTILPSEETIGFAWALAPETIDTSGFLIKFIISSVPYPDPLSDKWIDDTSPLKIGWTWALNVSVPTDDTPTAPPIWTVIGW